MATYLDRILDWHRQGAEADERDLARLAAAASACPPARGFTAALRSQEGISVIAEVKRRSPSKGLLAADLDPARLAKTYAAAGAACLSVLTDSEFFGGSPEDLAQARAAVELPVLRKDFTVCPADVYDARLMGADALLLIVSALSGDELVGLVDLANQAGIEALVEVHDEDEAKRALDAGAQLIGVNQRDLFSFEVDTERALSVGANLPADVVKVAESGIRERRDVEQLAAAGFDAVLVGEALVTAPDPGAALSALVS
ncbi:MAG: indole-3-glycerol phosphate synthase TrpC [Actinobacteria bacterium]|nr:indole-3-glycerol phosphate synthase TrpC [Actinomycetota bacterium]